MRADVLLAAVLAVVAIADALRSDNPAHVKLGLTATAIGMTVPLAFRRRAPLAVVAVIVAAFVARSIAPNPPDSIWQLVVLLIAVYSAGAHATLPAALAAAGLTAGGLAVAIAVDPSDAPANIAPTLLVFIVIPWLAGRALHGRAQAALRLEAEARALERRSDEAIDAERARISRELHDVIAHSVTVIALQADAAAVALERDPARAAEPLSVVRSTAREAVEEMRHLLALLREAPGDRLEPQPGLARLADLTAQVRATGLEVELDCAVNDRSLAPGLDLAAYRIVQEALTNVVKHASASRAAVRVREQAGGLTVEVRDDGCGASGRATGSGHGHVGMRERVALYGGTFEAGPDESGGFRVHAHFPLHA